MALSNILILFLTVNIAYTAVRLVRLARKLRSHSSVELDIPDVPEESRQFLLED